MNLKNAIRQLMEEYSMVTKLQADEVVMAMARLLTIEEEPAKVEEVKETTTTPTVKLTPAERMAKAREARKNK